MFLFSLIAWMTCTRATSSPVTKIEIGISIAISKFLCPLLPPPSLSFLSLSFFLSSSYLLIQYSISYLTPKAILQMIGDYNSKSHIE